MILMRSRKKAKRSEWKASERTTPENKVAAEEQHDQLSRYAAIVRAMYPGWDRIFAVFLTPSGRPSTTSESNPYFPVSYALVADVIDELLAAPSVSIAADVRMMLAHYRQLLRRHIVSDAQIAELCQRIYQEHRKALDLIFEYREYEQRALSELLRELVRSTSDLTLVENRDVRYVSFVPKLWETEHLAALGGGLGGVPSGLFVYFQLVNEPQRLSFYLGTGKAQPAESRRQQLNALALSEPSPFTPEVPSPSAQWFCLYRRVMLSAEDYRDGSPKQRQEAIRTQWADIVETTVPVLAQAVIDAAAAWEIEVAPQ
jgi:hypothetical protein